MRGADCTPGHLCLLSQCLLLLTNAAWYDFCLVDGFLLHFPPALWRTSTRRPYISYFLCALLPKKLMKRTHGALCKHTWSLVNDTPIVTCVYFVFQIQVLTNATRYVAFKWLTGLTYLCTHVHFVFTHVHISGLNSYTSSGFIFRVRPQTEKNGLLLSATKRFKLLF